MSHKKRTGATYNLFCPHCGGRARVRHSSAVTPTYKQAIVECTVDECGWRGNMDIVITATLTPSMQPDPHIHVPLSRAAAKRLQVAIDAAKPRTFSSEAAD